MASKDQTIGGIIFFVCVVIAIIYTVGLFFFGSPLSWSIEFMLVAIPVFLALLAILGIGAWIGWTMATTPPPIENLSEIEETKIENEEKQEEN